MPTASPICCESETHQKDSQVHVGSRWPGNLSRSHCSLGRHTALVDAQWLVSWQIFHVPHHHPARFFIILCKGSPPPTYAIDDFQKLIWPFVDCVALQGCSWNWYFGKHHEYCRGSRPLTKMPSPVVQAELWRQKGPCDLWLLQLLSDVRQVIEPL